MPEKNEFNVIGVMSGTSLDGLDIAFCTFIFKNNRWNFEIKKATTVPYSKALSTKLADIFYQSAEELSSFDFEYGAYIGSEINVFIKKHNLTQIDFVASHGHTVFHQPEKGFTVQIGNGNAIAATVALPVIYDFRSLDVALGGQGAPLVPAGDDLLFPEYDFCLNLGGFANISFEKNKKRIAFDICPVNILLNHLANKKQMSYDKNGALSASGNVITDLLEKLNSNKFYLKDSPKSLGREWFEKEILAEVEKFTHVTEDLLATSVEHIAIQISSVINNAGKKGSVLVTGGGAFNTFLIEKIKSKTSSEIVIPSDEIINYKEAMIFAFLGVLRIKKEINVYSGVTGASGDSCSGSVIWMSNQ